MKGLLGTNEIVRVNTLGIEKDEGSINGVAGERIKAD